MAFYAMTGRHDLLDAAVVALAPAVERAQLGQDEVPPEATLLLGRILVTRYRWSGNIGDLEAGAQYVSAASRATPVDHPDRSARMYALAETFIAVVQLFPAGYGTDLALQHLARVIGALRECIERSGPGDPLCARYFQGLGTAYDLRFVHSGDLDDVRTGLVHLQRALQHVSRDDRDLVAAIRGTTANLLFKRYEAEHRQRDLHRAVEELRRALLSAPEDSPHRPGLARNLAMMTTELPDGSETASAFRSVDRAARRPQEPFAVDHSYGETRAAWLADRGAWSEAAQVLAGAEQRLHRALAAQYGWRFKSFLLSAATPLAGNLAHALVRSGDILGAVAALDRGRTRLIDDACRLLALDPQQVREAGHAELADRLDSWLVDLREAEAAKRSRRNGSFHIPSERDRLLREGLDQLVEEIRREGGLDGFGRTGDGPPDWRLLRRPVVYLSESRFGGLALLVTPGEPLSPTAVDLPLLTNDALADMVNSFERAHASRAEDRSQWLAEVDRCGAWLWKAAMGPVVDAVRGLGLGLGLDEITVVACGRTGLLPLNAAWTEAADGSGRRRYVLDEFAVAFAPSGRHAAAPDLPPVGVPLDRVLVVDQHDPGREGMPALPAAGLEVAEISRLFPSAHVLSGSDATVSRVLDEVSGSSVVHFACHGRSVPDYMLESHLVLARGNLEVLELLGQRLGSPRLLVLSACETARVALDTPDEAIGLPTALLSAGADAVIASQWAVGDGAAGVLMRILHRTLAEGGGSPAAALRRAQIQLRDATNADLVSDGFRPAEDSASLGPLARRIWAASRPFAHPSDWAAFTLTGL
jgi:hypothetical protein